MRRVVASIAIVLVAAACGGGGDEGASPASTVSMGSSSTSSSTVSTATTATSLAVTSPGPPVTTESSPRASDPPRPLPPTPPATGSSTAALAPRDQALREAVDRAVAGRPVPFSVVAAHLPGAVDVGHRGNRQVLSASFYKLFVAEELIRRIDAGQLRGDQPMAGRTVDECLEAMIVVSDNPCGVAGLEMVGRGRHDATLRAQGYGQTALDTPQRTSADDVALFLRRQWEKKGRLWGLLARQQIRDRLPKGLPPGTPIAHKTGDRTYWAHDAGVVTTPAGDLLVVVVSGQWPADCCDAEKPGPPEARAFAEIADVGRILFEAATAVR